MQPSTSPAAHVHELLETYLVSPCSDCGELLWEGGLACAVDGCSYVTCECRTRKDPE